MAVALLLPDAPEETAVLEEDEVGTRGGCSDVPLVVVEVVNGGGEGE